MIVGAGLDPGEPPIDVAPVTSRFLYGPKRTWDLQKADCGERISAFATSSLGQSFGRTVLEPWSYSKVGRKYVLD